MEDIRRAPAPERRHRRAIRAPQNLLHRLGRRRRLDLIVDSQNACWFRNVREEQGEVWYEYMGNVNERILAGHTTCPTPIDWRGDGTPELLLGAEDGHFYRMANQQAQ